MGAFMAFICLELFIFTLEELKESHFGMYADSAEEDRTADFNATESKTYIFFVRNDLVRNICAKNIVKEVYVKDPKNKYTKKRKIRCGYISSLQRTGNRRSKFVCFRYLETVWK
ncbi:uncharacterized protein LOC143239318 isoform X2 [Tachypleus tridentatus]